MVAVARAVPKCPGDCGAASWRLVVRTSELASGDLTDGRPLYVGPELRHKGISAVCNVCGYEPMATSSTLGAIREIVGVG